MEENNPELEQAYNFIRHTRKHVFLTGKAGTGKTTFLHRLREETFKRMIVVAPTGVAAINAKGVTIHSFFQLPFGLYLPTQINRQSTSIQRFSKEKIDIIRSLDLVVVDEISMVRADLLDGIDEVLRRFRGINTAFGGVQLLLIGDLQQLSPIVKDEESALLHAHYETPYFFSSKALQQTDFIPIELTKVYRQSQTAFIDILNKIRENKADEDCFERLNQRYIPIPTSSNKEGYVTITTHNYQANQINQIEMDKLLVKSFIYQANIEGDFPPQNFPNEKELILKKGAQVMFLRNDYSKQKRYYNGKIGRISEINSKQIWVQCEDETSPILIERVCWENIHYQINPDTKQTEPKIVGTFEQYPIKAAWAITVHKSQGLTFEKAILEVNDSFAHGQVYVALSRCHSLDGIILSAPLSRSSIINDPNIKHFYHHLEEKKPGEDTLLTAKCEYCQYLLSDLFDFQPLLYCLYRFKKLIEIYGQAAFNFSYEQMEELILSCKKSLTEVGQKFIREIHQRLLVDGSIEKNSVLQERIKKACPYFLEQLHGLFDEQKLDFSTQSDNSKLKKALKEAASNFQRVLHIKRACLKSGSEGFQVNSFIDIRAKASLEEQTTDLRSTSNKQNTLHPILTARLLDFRQKKALELNTTEYKILPQKALNELRLKLPSNRQELTTIEGLGLKRIKESGLDILALIQAYCQEQGIQKEQLSIQQDPAPAPIKEHSREKSKKLFEEGLSIEEIARERNLSSTTIESHLLYFLESEEIQYERLIDKEKADTISTYFQEKPDSPLRQAKEELGENYSWFELNIGKTLALIQDVTTEE